MTAVALLPGSFSAAGNCPGLEPVTSELMFMQTTKDTESRHKIDELRWSKLMVRAQVGNEPDYRQLLTELTDVIYGFLRNRFGNHHFIDDCVQETLLAIHQARHTYDHCRPFRPWLFAIVRHKAIDMLRKQQTRNRVTEQYKGEQETLSQANLQNEAEHQVFRGHLLELLSDQHRDVLVLTKFIGFSTAEAAEKLGISQGLVKVRIHRAINKLKQTMEADAS